jgi:hypothetical protein
VIKIVINGCGTSGKDEFVKLFKTYCKDVLNISSIDPIKSWAEIIGYCGKKDEKDRKLLSDLKHISIEYSNFPFNYIINNINKSNCKIAFIHCREPKEIKKFVDYYKNNIYTVLIHRKGTSITSNKSDRDVYEYNYDYIINNDSDINTLNKKAKDFYKILLGDN